LASSFSKKIQTLVRNALRRTMIQCDRLASVTDPLNQVTTYAYDHGNLATATRLSQRDILFGLEHFLSCGCVKTAAELKWLLQIDAQAICFQLRHKESNRHSSSMRTQRVLVFVDESNVVSSVRALGRKLDWLKLRDYLANADRGRELIEMVVYAGLPPPMPEWQSEREKKNKFLHWLRSNGFLVVAKDCSPGDGKHYKANVDVLMAIDAVELSIEMRPEVVLLVTGDADFAHLALQLRRRGIRVEVAATAQTLGTGLKDAANEVIDLVPLFKTFELMNTGDQ